MMKFYTMQNIKSTNTKHKREKGKLDWKMMTPMENDMLELLWYQVNWNGLYDFIVCA